jgi:hypothetical protein
MSIIQVSPSIPRSLYGPFYPFFSLYIRTSDYKGRSNVLTIFGLFFIVSASLIWRLAFKCLSSVIAVRTASALLIIKTKGALDRVIYRYALNTSKVRTSPFGPIMSFTALTAIYRIACLSTCSSFNSCYKMSYARRKRVWRCSTLPILLYASIETFLILTAIVRASFWNSIDEKFFPASCTK